ncbi:hypothetical protein [Paraburkholderia humisilvae]|uniref:hypothetical protein n=1 Tax=Paraburkholderia humisilvae TaxID=627669 RepID=UPI0015837E48|nr:hypothetical protein [Paraburkholderia humisilvae]
METPPSCGHSTLLLRKIWRAAIALPPVVCLGTLAIWSAIILSVESLARLLYHFSFYSVGVVSSANLPK